MMPKIEVLDQTNGFNIFEHSFKKTDIVQDVENNANIDKVR